MKLSRKVKKIFHWENSQKPEFSLDKEIYSQLKPFRLPLFLLQLMMMIGTLGYVIIDDFSLLDAIYQTGITFTTVGFGEIAEISPEGRMFTITLIILGFAVFSLSIAILTDTVNKGTLFRLFKERSMLYKIARLKNHYVICYHNAYTIQLSEQFRKNHIPFVVIDQRDDMEEIAEKYKYPYFLNEDPHTERALLKSHLSSAKGMITFSKNIADNIAQIASVRLFEKELNRKPYYIICNAESLNDIEKLKKLGANSVVSPTKLMAQKVSSMAIRPDVENIIEEVMYKKEYGLDLEELKIPNFSWMIFKKLKETHLREVNNVSVVGIRQKDGQFLSMPKGDTIIIKGSSFLVIGKPNDIRDVKRLINRTKKPEELKFV
jgi:voltage-gated potassium channel